MTIHPIISIIQFELTFGMPDFYERVSAREPPSVKIENGENGGDWSG